jgi:hypothetical protein
VKQKSTFILRSIFLSVIMLGMAALACQTSTQYHASKELTLYKNNEQHYRELGRQAQAKGDTEEAEKQFAEAEYWRDKHKQAQIRYHDSLYLAPDDYNTERDQWHERSMDYSDDFKTKTKTTADTQ